MNTYAADVAELVEKLNLRDAIHIGHSTGGGEVARYVAKYGMTAYPEVIPTKCGSVRIGDDPGVCPI